MLLCQSNFQERAIALYKKFTTYYAPAAESTLADVIIAKPEHLKFKNTHRIHCNAPTTESAIGGVAIAA